MSDVQTGMPAGSELERQPGPERAPAIWQAGLSELSARREVIWLALAAAEMCWLAPVFWAVTWVMAPHSPFLLWLGLLVLMLGLFYFHRALVSAGLGLRLQQGLLAAGLLLCIGLVLRLHVLAGSGLRAVDWFLMPFRNVGQVSTRVPLSWITIMLLIYLWARAIHLATRSLSTETVGFSLRSGVIVLIAVAFLVKAFTTLDVSGFVVSFFFFALVAVALARVEEVSRMPNSTQAPFSGFWIGSTVGAVAVLVMLGGAVALALTAGGLDRLVHLLAPLLQVVEIIIFGIGMLLVLLIEWVLSLFSVDLTNLSGQLREAMSRLMLEPFPEVPPPEGEPQAWVILSRVFQVLITVVLPVCIVSLILYLTWRRMRQRSGAERGEESRESLLSGSALTNGLQSMLQDGLQHLRELADLAKRVGPGARFLTAVSIRRIYGNLVRMAAEAGYPRDRSQTPYEYLRTLRQVFPTNETEVTFITEAYVNAHYGEVPDSREEIQRIRDCWERVQASTRRGRGRE